jgi:hypothetical protein
MSTDNKPLADTVTAQNIIDTPQTMNEAPTRSLLDVVPTSDQVERALYPETSAQSFEQTVARAVATGLRSGLR